MKDKIYDSKQTGEKPYVYPQLGNAGLILNCSTGLTLMMPMLD